MISAAKTDILKSGHNCWQIKPVTESGVLIDGRDYYRAFYRAAANASRYILMSGWQFDSEVILLRGRDSRESIGETRLLPFLKSLCGRNPELRIYMLAWDFSWLFALEREWFQKWIFDWSSSPGMKFRFDSSHPVWASYHQKFVVIDGHTAFIGGMDICSSRWDDRRHEADNPHRTGPDSGPYGPYHDVQAFVRGEAVDVLTGLFQYRWIETGGDPIEFPPLSTRHENSSLYAIPGLSLPIKNVAFSRTQGRLSASSPAVLEIQRQYVDAIMAARETIYLENQYFTSEIVTRALADRMGQGGPPIEIIMVLPKGPEDFLEQAVLGAAQARLVGRLRSIARFTGHSIGIYYPMSKIYGPDGMQKPVYIHSKLLIIDDRFLMVGSANTTNRSLGVDMELNISWEAPAGDREAASAIRRLRTGLIGEHAGLRSCAGRRELLQNKKTVEVLDRLASAPSGTLMHVPENNVPLESKISHAISLESFFDPSKAGLEEAFYEAISTLANGSFTKGITRLWRVISGVEKDQPVPKKTFLP